MSNSRLSPEAWNQLDDLLGKHGFGGYYDLLECLKMAINDMLKALGRDKEKLPPIEDLPSAVHVINTLASQLAKQTKEGP